MNRLHVHVGVADLSASVEFYSGLFGVSPDTLETDYAKWMLDDPLLNFAISTRCGKLGIDHLGIQCEDEVNLAEAAERLAHVGRPTIRQHNASCCYATGQKVWISDPQGVAWETFLTTGEITNFGEDRIDLADLEPEDCREKSNCCSAPNTD